MIEGKQIEIFIECFKENSNLTFNSGESTTSSKIHTLSVVVTIKYKGQ